MAYVLKFISTKYTHALCVCVKECSETYCTYLLQGQPLLWRGCSRMPCGFVRPHVVVKGSTVFVGGGNTGKMESTRTVYVYNTLKDAWCSLPITPYYTFALALVKGYVTGERWILLCIHTDIVHGKGVVFLFALVSLL